MDKFTDYMNRREAINRAAFRRAAGAVNRRPIVKAVISIIGFWAVVACIISFYGVGLLLFAAAVILGLASKS